MAEGAVGRGGGRRRRIWRVVIGDQRRFVDRARIWPGGANLLWSGAEPALPPVDAAGQVGHAVLHAESVSWLRRFLAEPAMITPVQRVTLLVDGWRPPRPGWSGRLGPVPALGRHEVVLPRLTGTVRVTVEVRAVLPLHEILSAALAVLTPVRALPRPASADVTALGAAPAWLPANPNHIICGHPPDSAEDIRAHDTVLAPDAAVVPAGREVAGVVLTAGATGARVINRQPVVLIDSAVANPIGRNRTYGGHEASARLEFEVVGPVPRWRLLAEPAAQPTFRQARVLGEGSLDDVPLGAHQLAAVRGVANLSCADLPGIAPAAEAVLLAQFAATGVVLRVGCLPPAVADRLAQPLLDVLTADLPDAAGDGLEWEIRSVRQRCAALRSHAAAFALGEVTAGTFTGLAAPPSVSAILVTRRPEYISDAVAYLARQTYPELEIVLCLHGIDLDVRTRSDLAECGRPIQVFTVPAAFSFGEVMGAATAQARGSLVTKVDDDDVYGPEHVWDLVLAREFSGATLVGKAAEFVYLQTLGVTVRRRAVPPETYGPPVAGGTMLIGRGDLEAIGGWRPVPRSVDRGLMDRVTRAGGLVYRTHPLGYLYERRADGHTWDAGLDYFLHRSGQQWHGLPRHREFGTEGFGAVPVG